MKKILSSAIKNIKDCLILNIIILFLSVIFLFSAHYVFYSIYNNDNANTKYSKVFQVYRVGEDEDVFYFNDYDATDIKDELYSIYKNLGIKSVKKNIMFPATLILRTLSEYVLIDAYEDYSSFSNNMIVEGNLFSDTNNSVIVSENMPLKTNEVFQLFIRDSLSGYKARAFFVSGIYSLSNTTDDTIPSVSLNENVVYTSLNAVTNFLYTVGSGKNPYFERYILYFNNYKKVEDIISDFDINGFVINGIEKSENYILDIKNIYFVFATIGIIFAYIFITASLNYLQIQYRVSLGYKDLLKRSCFVQIFIINFCSITLYFIIQKLLSKNYDILLFIPVIVLLLSSIVSLLLSVFREYKYDI